MRPFKTSLVSIANRPIGWISRVNRAGARRLWKDIKAAARSYFKPLAKKEVVMDRLIVGKYHRNGRRDPISNDTIADHVRDEFGTSVNPRPMIGGLWIDLTHRVEGEVTLFLDRNYADFEYTVNDQENHA